MRARLNSPDWLCVCRYASSAARRMIARLLHPGGRPKKTRVCRSQCATRADPLPSRTGDRVGRFFRLAAAYWIFRKDESFGVRTKDVDCVLSAYVAAVDKGRAVAGALLAAGWTPQDDGVFAKRGTADTPDARLPAVRLYPPECRDWFIELLTEPASEDQTERGPTIGNIGVHIEKDVNPNIGLDDRHFRAAHRYRGADASSAEWALGR